jgi:hypothetical protein
MAERITSTRLHDPGGRVRLRLPDGTVSDAAFSPCDRYRWWLERRWDGQPVGSGNVAVQIGLNPSTADIDCDDPTVAGCCDRARRWGHGGLVMLNAFGYRATNKAELLKIDDPIGQQNDAAIRRHAKRAAVLVVGWGQLPRGLLGRAIDIARILADEGVTPMCFAVNADGSPKHPLYVRRDAPLIPWPMPA